MPKTRKSEMTPSAGAAPAPTRRRAATSSAATSRKRTAAEPVTEPTPVVASVTEIVMETVTVESVVIEPAHEQIAALAYLYWVGRGYQGGSPEEDWLRAEQELRQCVATATVA
jgi:hypothetical protein